MRAEYTLALCRESEEFERAMVERRVEQAFEHVYETLLPVTNDLRNVLSQDARHMLDQLERAYLQAIEFAARSGIGCQVARSDGHLRGQRARIPLAPAPKPVATAVTAATADPDQVINVRPCG